MCRDHDSGCVETERTSTDRDYGSVETERWTFPDRDRDCVETVIGAVQRMWQGLCRYGDRDCAENVVGTV
jgi:hypothetical protein